MAQKAHYNHDAEHWSVDISPEFVGEMNTPLISGASDTNARVNFIMTKRNVWPWSGISSALTKRKRVRKQRQALLGMSLTPLEQRALMTTGLAAIVESVDNPTADASASDMLQVDYGAALVQAQQVAAPTLTLDTADDPNGDSVVLGSTVTLTGTATAGAKVLLDINADGDFERSTTADAQGEYSFEARLRPGVNRFATAVRTGPKSFERSETITVRRLPRLANGARIQEIATGLNSPRALQVGPNGRLFVTVAGTGGNKAFLTGPDGRPLGLGDNSAVLGINQRGKVISILSGLPSLANSDGDDATGANGLIVTSRNQAFVLMGLGANPADRVNVLNEPRLGQLIAFNPLTGGNVRTFADISALEQANNYDQTQVDSNPFNIIRYRDGFAVVDAGANALHILNAQGQAVETFVFPTQLTPLPNNSAVSIPAQAVPTSVAEGPDGALYVGQLTGFPFQTGSARIFRVVPGSGNAPEVYQTGFTHIIRLAFAANGDLLVLQYSDVSILAGNPSASLIRVSPNGNRTVITNQLNNPTGLTIGPDGSIYVADSGFSAGSGRILRFGPGRGR